MFLLFYNNPSSTKKLPVVDTLISGTRQLDFDQFLFYYKNRSGVGLIINFRHRSSAILFLVYSRCASSATVTLFFFLALVPIFKLSHQVLLFPEFRATMKNSMSCASQYCNTYLVSRVYVTCVWVGA